MHSAAQPLSSTFRPTRTDSGRAEFRGPPPATPLRSHEASRAVRVPENANGVGAKASSPLNQNPHARPCACIARGNVHMLVALLSSMCGGPLRRPARCTSDPRRGPQDFPNLVSRVRPHLLARLERRRITSRHNQSDQPEGFSGAQIFRSRAPIFLSYRHRGPRAGCPHSACLLARPTPLTSPRLDCCRAPLQRVTATL